MDKNTPVWPAVKDDELCYYVKLFYQLGPVDGYLSGDDLRDFFLQSGLTLRVLSQIWNLTDETIDNLLDIHEFISAVHLICGKTQGRKLPQLLPDCLPVDLRDIPLPLITEGEYRCYRQEFIKNSHDNEYLQGANLVQVLKSFNLNDDQLTNVWRWTDMDFDNRLSLTEFVLLSHLANCSKEGVDLAKVYLNVLSLLPGYQPPINTPAGKKARLKYIQDQLHTLESRQVSCTSDGLPLEESNKYGNVDEEVNQLRAEVVQLKKEVDAIDSHITSSTKRKVTRATKDPDPFHQLHELRKEERKKGRKQSHTNPPPLQNPFNLQEILGNWFSGNDFLQKLETSMDSEEDVWLTPQSPDISFADESSGFEDNFTDVIQTPDSWSCSNSGTVTPEFLIADDDVPSSPVFKTISVTAEEDELWCSLGSSTNSEIAGHLHKRNLSRILEVSDIDLSANQSDTRHEDSIPDIIIGLEQDQGRAETEVDVISNVQRSHKMPDETLPQVHLDNNANNKKYLGGQNIKAGDPFNNVSNSVNGDLISEDSFIKVRTVSTPKSIAIKSTLSHNDSFEELSYVLHRTPSPRFGVPFHFEKTLESPIAKSSPLTLKKGQCNIPRSIETKDNKTSELSFKAKMEQAFSSRKQDLESRRAQFFGYDLSPGGPEEPQGNDISVSMNDNVAVSEELESECVIQPQKVSRAMVLPEEFGFVDNTAMPVESQMNGGRTSPDIFIPPPFIPEPEIKIDKEVAVEEEITPQIVERKKENVADLLSNVANAQKFIAFTKKSVKDSRRMSDSQMSQDSDISDDDGNNLQASFTPGQQDMLDNSHDSDCDSGNVTLISHQSFQIEDSEFQESDIPPPAEFDFGETSRMGSDLPPPVEFSLSPEVPVSQQPIDEEECSSVRTIPSETLPPPQDFTQVPGDKMEDNKEEINLCIPPPNDFLQSAEPASNQKKGVSFQLGVEEIPDVQPVLTSPAENYAQPLETDGDQNKGVSYQIGVKEVPEKQPAPVVPRKPMNSRYALLSAPKGWGKRTEFTSKHEPVKTSFLGKKAQSLDSLLDTQDVITANDDVPVSSSSMLFTSVQRSEPAEQPSVQDIKPTGSDEYRPMECCYSADDLQAGQFIVSGENTPPVLTPKEEKLPSRAVGFSTNQPAYTPAFNKVTQPTSQKHLASSSDIQRAMDMAESITETSFLGEQVSPVSKPSREEEVESNYGQSQQPEHLEIERRSLIKQMRVKRKKVSNQWTSQESEDISPAAPPSGGSVNQSLKLFEERKMMAKEKEASMPEVTKAVTTTTPVVEKNAFVEPMKGEVDNTSLKDIRSATKNLWEKRTQLVETNYIAQRTKPAVIGKIWDIEPEMDTNKLSYVVANSNTQMDKSLDGEIFDKKYSEKSCDEDCLIVAPPTGFGDSLTQESALDREIRLANERELQLKLDTEKVHKEVEMIKIEDVSPNSLNESIIEREIRNQAVREQEWIKEGHIHDQSVSKEQSAYSEMEKEEDTAGESIIEREIRLQAEKEARMRNEHLRLNLPVGSRSDSELISPPEFSEQQIKATPVMNIHREGSVKEQSGYTHRGESLIARELREAREREEEYLQLKEQMQSQKSSVVQSPVISSPANRPSSIIRVPSSDKSSASSNMSTASSGYRSYQSPATTPRSEQSFQLATHPPDVAPFKRSSSQDSLLSSASSTGSSLPSENLGSTGAKRVPKVKPVDDEPVQAQPAAPEKKETPIEREIRLAKERENEYRRARGIPDKKEDNDEVLLEVDYNPVHRTPTKKVDSTFMKKFSTSSIQKDINETKKREMEHSGDSPHHLATSSPITTVNQLSQSFVETKTTPRQTSVEKQLFVEPKPSPRHPLQKSTGVRDSPAQIMIIDKTIDIQDISPSVSEEPKSKLAPSPAKPVERSSSINRPLTEEEREGLKRGQKFVMRRSSFKAETKIEQEMRELIDREEELKNQRHDSPKPAPTTTGVTVSTRSQPAVSPREVADSPNDEPAAKVEPVNFRRSNPLVRGTDRAKRRSLLAERWQQRVQEGPEDGDE